MRTFKETSKIVEEVANIALQAAEEKGLTFREVLYLPEMIDASKPSQRNLNDKNSRRYFIRLANINFGENDLWCTFTWDKDHIPADEERPISFNVAPLVCNVFCSVSMEIPVSCPAFVRRPNTSPVWLLSTPNFVIMASTLSIAPFKSVPLISEN